MICILQEMILERNTKAHELLMLDMICINSLGQSIPRSRRETTRRIDKYGYTRERTSQRFERVDRIIRRYTKMTSIRLPRESVYHMDVYRALVL